MYIVAPGLGLDMPQEPAGSLASEEEKPIQIKIEPQETK